VQSRGSSDKTLFIRTHIAIYFFSLILCNFIQASGAFLYIPWIVKGRVYVGRVCTAQAIIKQLGNVRDCAYCTVEVVLTPLTILDWDSNFLFCNRRPHLQPTLPSSSMVGSHMLHRPYFLMGPPPAPGVHRKFYYRRPKRERTIPRNRWLLVLDHAPIPNRTFCHVLPLHARRRSILLRPLFPRVLPTARQYHGFGGIQNLFSSTAQGQVWQNGEWSVCGNR
jgi:hypothetical protein